MELCLGIFGFFYVVLHGMLGLALLMVILPMMAAKVASILKLKSVNLLLIFIWMLAYAGWFIFTNKNYIFIYQEYLPSMTCRYIL